MPPKVTPKQVAGPDKRAAPTANPFNYGRELGPHELADRKEEVSEAARAMLEGGKLFLIGPRRYGKTSIIRAAELKAIKAGAVVLRYDASAFPNVDVLTARIATDAASALAGGAERVLRAVKNLFGALRPTVSIDVNSGAPTITFEGGSAGRGGPVPLLTDVLNGIEAAALKQKRRVAVVFDEFQEIVEMGGGEKAEQQIRAAIQRHKHVGYVFAGSKTQLLTEMTTSHGRAFYNLGDKRFLGPVPRADFSALLKTGFAAGSIPIADGALTAMLDLAEDVPYTVQLLARACWDTSRAATPEGGTPTTLTTAVVAQVHERIVREHDASFSIIWEGITLTQHTALRALVETGGVGLASADVSRRYNISISTLRTALISLKQHGILRDERLLGVGQTRFEDPLFGAWVRLVVNP